ncbi:alcohol dehydrogenase catalytic domain-containing protein [Pedosphaera parvula]|uniref:Alcohol dehydrogenase GroES domain protein n=1 Tax=Pedosphaera parvula (strain Ellin514) TaxID=320771 RepID=B9XPA4_PEDPL|nr:zinc-binding dehydrogenase [Pedosphaera parvula]EEF58355.1 Alcohol dehydrogenase GroES domain protein [Pedosphaera parvula Ellin514]
MKAVRLIKPGQPLEMQEIPIPQIGPSDVLIKVKAAGICHSDAHYRAGNSRVDPLPLTLGHEVAGVIENVGLNVKRFQAGDRVCVHYLATCGDCEYCSQGSEQFCTTGQMIGKYRDGGYAEYMAIPARSVFKLPDEIPFEQGAVMMCSSATSLHALNKARIRAGESVAIFGVGGLGISAVQLAQAFGASQVYAVDIKFSKLDFAKRLGAIPIDASTTDPVAEIKRLTNGRGVDVALELIGLPLTMKQALQSLAIKGRAMLVGITQQSFAVSPYHEVLNKEAEIIGVSDHLASEIPQLLDWARVGKLNLKEVITQTVPLDADGINHSLDRLEQFGDQVRVVITP